MNITKIDSVRLNPPAPIDTNKPPVNKPKAVKFTADSITFFVQETIYEHPFRKVIISIPWDNITTDFKAIVDTTGRITHFWLNLYIENNIFLDSLRVELEHIKAIKMILDSIPASAMFKLNKGLNSGLWSAVFMENVPFVPGNPNKSYEGTDSPLEILFLDDLRYPTHGVITALISGRISSKFQRRPSQITIDALLYIHYKIQ